MCASACVTNGLAPNVLREQAALAKRAEEHRTAFCLGGHNDWLFAPLHYNKDVVRRHKALVFETNSPDLTPPKRLIPSGLQTLQNLSLIHI